jgi:hypothetical protein
LSSPPDPVPRQRLAALVIAVLFAVGWHAWVGDAHINPAEEGYLWYGTWRTGLGEVPIRDFQSYDPGRYYACAALERLLGTGILGLRRSIACFQGLGLLFGLLAARRATRSSLALVPVAVVLGLWLFPRHKVFEGVIALACAWLGARLLESPTRGRHAALGACAGLAAFVGRNLGLYAALGSAVLLGVSAWKRRDQDWLRKGASFALGVVLGYAPMLVLLSFVPGFFGSFVESMRLLLRLGANIAAPWLWPWRVEFAGLPAREVLARLSLALVYLLPVTLLPLGGWLLLRARVEDLPRRALAGSAAVFGAFFIHHAAVRSDASHLAQSLQPTLLAGVALVGLCAARRPVLGALLALGLGLPVAFAAFEHNPALNHVGHAALVPAQLGPDTLYFLPQQADYYTRLQRALAGRVGPDEKLFIAPSRPAFYPLFGKRSPTWWIYFFVPDPPPEEEERIIAELADVPWILIVDQAIAELEDLRFRNSYARVWAHIQAHYRRVPTNELEPNHLLLRRAQ